MSITLLYKEIDMKENSETLKCPACGAEVIWLCDHCGKCWDCCEACNDEEEYDEEE